MRSPLPHCKILLAEVSSKYQVRNRCRKECRKACPVLARRAGVDNLKGVLPKGVRPHNSVSRRRKAASIHSRLSAAFSVASRRVDHLVEGEHRHRSHHKGRQQLPHRRNRYPGNDQCRGCSKLNHRPPEPRYAPKLGLGQGDRVVARRVRSTCAR